MTTVYQSRAFLHFPHPWKFTCATSQTILLTHIQQATVDLILTELIGFASSRMSHSFLCVCYWLFFSLIILFIHVCYYLPELYPRGPIYINPAAKTREDTRKKHDIAWGWNKYHYKFIHWTFCMSCLMDFYPRVVFYSKVYVFLGGHLSCFVFESITDLRSCLSISTPVLVWIYFHCSQINTWEKWQRNILCIC